MALLTGLGLLGLGLGEGMASVAGVAVYSGLVPGPNLAETVTVFTEVHA